MVGSKSYKSALTIANFVGLSFLWPYYQRAFYRVTLFYRLGERAEAGYGLFLVLLLAGCVVAAVKYRAIEALLDREPILFAGAAVFSLMTGSYLMGVVMPSAEAAPVLSLLAVVGYAVTFLIISAGAVLMLMRLVYTVGLFQGAAVLSASSMMGKVLSPVTATSDSLFGFVPVVGLLVAGLSVALSPRAPSTVEATSSYDRLTKAPYLKTWLLPLSAYFVLSVSHAFRYAFDMTNEVSAVGGEIVPAAVSHFPVISYFTFAGLLLVASAHSTRGNIPSWNRSAFWVAALGVAVGLLATPVLMSLAEFGDDLVTFDAGLSLTLLLAVCILLFTYQNRLSPLQTFGVFLCSALVVEKIVTYLLCPPLLASIGQTAATGVYPTIMISELATLIMLFLFLARLCQGNVLALLFPASASPSADGERDRRRTVCATIGKEAGLSDREVDVLYYLSCGYSAKRTGETLFISERTAQTHTQNIYRKLGVHNRQAIIDLIEDVERDRREGGK